MLDTRIVDHDPQPVDLGEKQRLPEHAVSSAPGRLTQLSESAAATVAEQKTDEAELASVQPLHVAVRAFERAYIDRVLRAADGKRLRAAAILGISRKTLWEKLRRSPSEDDV